MLSLRVIFIAILFLAFSAHAQNRGSQMNQEEYTPPTMPNYPTSYEEVMATLAPYYHEDRPLDYFFELYVVNTLELLPAETVASINEFSTKHPSFFESTNGDWKAYVVKQFHLSDTIDVAIWDLWIRNKNNAAEKGWDYHPWHYAQNFLENYVDEDSRVDVWEGNALKMAKKRIEEYRNNGN